MKNNILKPSKNMNLTIGSESNLEIISYKHCIHSRRRASQRGITDKMISYVIEYGVAYFKQGLIFYVLGGKHDFNETKDFSKYRNIIVLVSEASNKIITCYRRKNPFRYIEKKTKINISNLQ